MDASISWVAVAAAAASFFVIGGLWYSVVFARPWASAAAVSPEQLGSGAARVFGGSALLSVVIAVSLAAFLGEATVPAGLGVGAVAGVTFAAAPLWMVMLFERRPLRLALIDGGYLIAAFAVAGGVIGALQ